MTGLPAAQSVTPNKGKRFFQGTCDGRLVFAEASDVGQYGNGQGVAA